MSSATKLADEYADIAKRLKEIEAEKSKAILESPIEQVGEAAIGWTYVQSTDLDYVC